MNIFVTGGQGFVGKLLVPHLKSAGFEPLAVDIAPSNEFCATADVRNERIAEMIPRGCEALIHLAGLTRNTDCSNNALACFDANVMATLNLIKGAVARDVKQFIFASSEWVYGEWKDPGLVKDEDALIDPISLTSEYAFSKLVSEVNLRQKFRHGFCSTTILRFGIIYGPRIANWSAVESLFHSVRTLDKVNVGSVRTGRCFIHVEDIVSGIIKSIGLNGLNTINLQGDCFISLGEIIETSGRLLGRSPTIMETDPNNFNVRNVSNCRAGELIGWRPNFDLERGLGSLFL